jgi:hypothetical protein
LGNPSYMWGNVYYAKNRAMGVNANLQQNACKF